MNLTTITKRTGELVPYDKLKIRNAIAGANGESVEKMSERDIDNVTEQIESTIQDRSTVSVEEIQDIVETKLMEHGFYEVAKKYITYRYKHMLRREGKKNLMHTYKDILFADAIAIDSKRENANINTDAPMGIMLKLGTEGAKQFLSEMLPEKFDKMNRENWCHIHKLHCGFVA